MNAQTFLTNFGHFANAPNGVAKLRELVLNLAMQGKLVQQSSKDLPATSLLEEVEAEKHRIAKERGARPHKQQLDISAQEIPYPPPPGWEWVRFGHIAQHNSGKTLDKGRNTGHPRDYITTSNLYWGTFVLEGLRQMLIRDDELERCTARKGDLLICEGGEAGRAAVWNYDKEVSFQNHIHRARFYCGIDPYYAYRFLQKLNATGEINRYRKGVGISNMSGKALASIPFPLPPVAEQRRIVAKIDELMTLCDTLGAQQRERKERFPTLSMVCHTRYAEAPSPDNLNRIFGEIGTVSPEDLRKTILTLGVQGKLLEGDSNEEAPDRVLEEMQKRRQHLIDEKKIRNPSVLPPVEPDEIPFPVRNSWRWTRWGQICDWITYGFTRPMQHVHNGPPIITAKNVQDGFITFQNAHRAAAREFEELSPKDRPRRGDVLITKDGTIGRAAIVETDEPFCINQSVAVLWLESCLLFRPFLLMVIRSPFAQVPIWEAAEGMAIKHLSITDFGRMILPVPPPAEQRRIVAKVDQLMGLVDTLEKQQCERDQLAATFAKAVVSSLTGTQIEERTKMKPPKTDLISILEIGAKPKATDDAPLAKLLTRAKGKLPAKVLWQ